MATFEGSFLSIRSVNALSHNTDWTVGHVHNGALGWVAGIAFGMIYWMLPRLWKTELYSRSLANLHFWLATIGIILYVVSMWIAGIMQGSMWFAFDPESGLLVYNQWAEFVDAILPYHYLRAIGGALFIAGFCLMLFNVLKTILGKQVVEDETTKVPSRFYDKLDIDDSVKGGSGMKIHDLLERWPFALTILSALALSAGGLMEIVPSLVQSAATEQNENIEPYTPLELAGRDLYIREGCNACHTQMVRTLRADTARFAATAKHGTYTRSEEHVYDRPFLWGSKRTGPDLAREGEIRPGAGWHWNHMWEPEITSERSIMPSYKHLYRYDLDTSDLSARMKTLQYLLHPYSNDEIVNAEKHAKEQAAAIAALIEANPTTEPPMPENLADKEIIALIAYLNRLGLPKSPEPKP